METKIKYLVTFETIVEVKYNDAPTAELEQQARPDIIRNAQQRVAQSPHVHSIEKIYEAISEDQAGEDKVPGHNDGREETDNDVGTVERQDPDNDQKLRGDEQGEVQRDDSSSAGYNRNGEQNNPEEERGLHVDKAV